MLRRFCSLFLVLLLVGSLCACSPSDSNEENAPIGSETTLHDENIGDNVPENGGTAKVEFDFSFLDGFTWGLYDTNFDIVSYPNIGSSMSTNYIDFTLLSTTLLTEDDIQISSDVSWEFLPPILYLDPNSIDGDAKKYPDQDLYYVCKGIATAEEIESFNKTGSPAKLWDWYNAFQKTNRSERPYVYEYYLSIGWNIFYDPDYYAYQPEANNVLDGFDITIKGETRHIDIANISYCYDEADYTEDPNHSLWCRNPSFVVSSAVISSNGVFQIFRVTYVVNDDVTITGIDFYRNDDVEIQKATFQQTIDEDFTIDLAWEEGKSLEFSAGDEFELTVVACDPWFADNPGGTKSEYLMLEYQVGSETYTECVAAYCHQSIYDPFAYIALDLGYDVLPLYYQDDFYSNGR